jgi:putative flippase GtrA
MAVWLLIKGIVSHKYIQFLAAGVPGLLLALPLNLLLVEWAGLSKQIAYALVLLLQVSVNYVMCRWFVFRADDRQQGGLQEFLGFMGGILCFRLGDWALYVALVQWVSVHYLLIQLFNVVVFSVFKFLFSRWLFARGRSVPGRQTA